MSELRPKLKPHPNSPRGRAGRAATAKARMERDGAWAASQHDIADYAGDVPKSPRKGSKWKPLMPKHAPKRGTVMVTGSPSVKAKVGDGKMRPTFIRPAEGGGFEYGVVKVHRWVRHKDKYIVRGTVETYREALTLSGRLG